MTGAAASDPRALRQPVEVSDTVMRCVWPRRSLAVSNCDRDQHLHPPLEIGGEQQSGGSSRRFDWVIVAVMGVVALGYRPSVLGFYHDDWPALFTLPDTGPPLSLERFFFVTRTFITRPVMGLAHLLLAGVCDDSALAWQTVLVLFNLATALAVTRFVRRLLALIGWQTRWAAEFAGCCWLVFPWHLGSTVWPNAGPTLLAVIFFCLSGASLFRGWTEGRYSAGVPAGLYILSCLSYEAFFGQFAALFLLGLGCVPMTRVRHVVGQGVMFAATQSLAVVWNRCSPWLISETSPKSINADWWRLVLQNLGSGGLELGASFREHWTVTVSWLAVGIVWGMVGATMLWRQGDQHRKVRLLALAFAACMAGGVISMVLYALVGYAVTGVGTFSRTTMPLSVWIASGFGLTFAAAAAASRTTPLRWLLALWACAVIPILASAMHLRVGEWKSTWEMEQSILRHAPLDALQHARDDAVVVMHPACHTACVYGFNAPWDLAAAMHYSHPETRRLRFLVAIDCFSIHWDGAQVVQQGDSSSPLVRMATSEVWLWDHRKHSVHSVSVPWHWPEQP